MSLNSARPSLYRLAADGVAVELLFGQCPVCAALTFPANAYGCQACGADGLRVEARPAEGILLARTMLHANVSPAVPAPQAVGDVEIAPGIVEEVLLTDEALEPGVVVRGLARDLGDGTFDCVFGA